MLVGPQLSGLVSTPAPTCLLAQSWALFPSLERCTTTLLFHSHTHTLDK